MFLFSVNLEVTDGIYSDANTTILYGKIQKERTSIENCYCYATNAGNQEPI